MNLLVPGFPTHFGQFNVRVDPTEVSWLPGLRTSTIFSESEVTMSIEDKAFAAAKSGATDAFSAYLLGLEKTVHYRDEVNNTPLHYAAANGHLDLVEIFLLNDADVNAVNNFMETPLHDAAGKGHTNVVERLLQVKGIQIDLQTDEGWTALHLATEKDHAEVVELLLNHGADLTIQDNGGEEAVVYAHSPKLIQVIRSHSSENLLGAGTVTPRSHPAATARADLEREDSVFTKAAPTKEDNNNTAGPAPELSQPVSKEEKTQEVRSEEKVNLNKEHSVNTVNTVNCSSGSGKDTVDCTDALETIDIEDKNDKRVASEGAPSPGVATNQCCTIM